jgi:cytokinesis protein
MDGAVDEGGSVAGDGQGTPTTVVHPPSPEQKGRELPTPPPE